MRTFILPYGQTNLSITLPERGYLGTFLPNKEREGDSEQELIRVALASPLGSRPVGELVQGKKNVVIVTSDLTRPCPNDVILPPLLAELSRAGIKDEQITIVIALGLHRKMNDEELRLSVGEEIFRRIRVINHDISDVVSYGTTSRGTPVEIFRAVAESDFRICVGNVEFHYFAGFSGGAKAIMPGVASEEAVKANHSHMTHELAEPGNLKHNPVREDLEEAVHMIGADFILNVITDENKRVVHAASGHVEIAHRHLCTILEHEGLVRVPQTFDFAVVSAGGYPKDIDLYQAQKALDNCYRIVKSGGVLILLAECLEGYGNATFTTWMEEKTSEQILTEIKENFVLGGHKAAAIAQVTASIHVILVTKEQAFPKNMAGINVVSNWDEAWQQAKELLPETFTYGVFPLGASTLPAP